MALVSFCLPVFFFNLANFHSSGLVGHLSRAMLIDSFPSVCDVYQRAAIN